ncbi:phosphotransferase [Psychromarinibacter sp. C21-152]|uniref:Phosphotransferase n=1 Tax=Psychromarinibacter sediminicola TaxID=3033385 RepID=A0AAE3TAM5_9RHOB|nr:phosphotransferase [Psychromarinibacter sediminicola]MDF0603008.1 phosphotransferase [Psychromarinibacter sediminicola]
MNDTVEKALRLWGMDGAEHRVFAARENVVHKVRHEGAAYALRLHRAGYRSDDELVSELEMMEAARQAGLHVPAPVVSERGNVAETVDDVQVDMLSWLDGAPVGKSGEPLAPSCGPALFRSIGGEVARLHAAMDDWTPPPQFSRCAWDHDGLLGEAPVWGRFWENPTLNPADRELFVRLRDVAGADLAALAPGLDYGLIHADLVRENVILEGERVQLIDFDDAGFGFRLFDIATTLLKNIDEPAYADLKSGLLAGYHAVRPLDVAALDLFLALRSATYVGWIASKLNEEGAAARNDRFVARTRWLAQGYLARKGATA